MNILLATAYLPPISYIAESLRHDRLIIEVFESYSKQTCRNHCTIAGPNRKQQLTVPVNKVNGNHTLTKEIRISNDERWQRMHWRSIETAYNNSPFFIYYRDYFEPFFNKKYEFLIDLNTQLLESLFLVLRVEKIIDYTKCFEIHPQEVLDLREDKHIILDHPGSGFEPYTQVFENKYGFIPDMSIIDLIFNLGTETKEYLL